MLWASVPFLPSTSPTLVATAPSTLISVLVLFLAALSIGLVTLLVLFGKRRELRVCPTGGASELRVAASQGVKDVVSALQHGLEVGCHVHSSDSLLLWFRQHPPP